MDEQKIVNAGPKPALIPSLQDLPTDVLLLIFKYCDYCDLIRLSLLCRRFYDIIKDDHIWLQKSRTSLVSNVLSNEIKKRFCYHLQNREKVRLSYNWRYGRYKEDTVFCLGSKIMPWLCLGNDHVWLSKKNIIIAFKISRRGSHLKVNRHTGFSLHGHSEDICRFVLKDGFIVSGGRDNSIYGFSADLQHRPGEVLFHKNHAHHSDVTAVDMQDKVVTSGSSDGTVKVWKVNETNTGEEMEMTAVSMVHIRDAIRSIAVKPDSDECLVGSSGYTTSPIHLYNIERGVNIVNFNFCFQLGAGILDVHWETPQVALTAGYDTYIRLWDCRTGNTELSWCDPFDSTIYCLSTDNLYTILAGTYNHGRVQLWDKRQTCSVQMYFLSSPYRRRSSVYSLAFDPCNMYVALDQSLNVIDFAGYRNNPKDQMYLWNGRE